MPELYSPFVPLGAGIIHKIGEVDYGRERAPAPSKVQAADSIV
jgi:hypothetical protein